jgi:LysM repeat protein
MTTYIVQPGDSISKIALKYYGTYSAIGTFNPIAAIAAASGISNPNVISVGQVLNIPDKPGAAPSSSTVTVANTGSGSTGTTAATKADASASNMPAPPAAKSSNMLWWIIGAIAVAGGGAIALKKYKERKVKKTAKA